MPCSVLLEKFYFQAVWISEESQSDAVAGVHGVHMELNPFGDQVLVHSINVVHLKRYVGQAAVVWRSWLCAVFAFYQFQASAPKIDESDVCSAVLYAAHHRQTEYLSVKSLGFCQVRGESPYMVWFSYSHWSSLKGCKFWDVGFRRGFCRDSFRFNVFVSFQGKAASGHEAPFC